MLALTEQSVFAALGLIAEESEPSGRALTSADVCFVPHSGRLVLRRVMSAKCQEQTLKAC
jgi:hypothetical protein